MTPHDHTFRCSLLKKKSFNAPHPHHVYFYAYPQEGTWLQLATLAASHNAAEEVTGKELAAMLATDFVNRRPAVSQAA